MPTETTICRVPPDEPAHYCNNPQGDSLCGDCSVSRCWLLQLVNQLPPETPLRIISGTHSLSLRENAHRSTLASVVSGIPHDNTPPKTN